MVRDKEVQLYSLKANIYASPSNYFVQCTDNYFSSFKLFLISDYFSTRFFINGPSTPGRQDGWVLLRVISRKEWTKKCNFGNPI
jgi:hypothetical protein